MNCFSLRFIITIFSIMILSISYSNAQFNPSKPYTIAPQAPSLNKTEELPEAPWLTNRNKSGFNIISNFEVRLEGEINEDLFIAVENYFKNDHRFESVRFKLNSKGGSVYAAIKIGRILREQDARIEVDMECLSSCFLIYIAGVDRRLAMKIKDIHVNPNTGRKYDKTLHAVIGLHRPYYNLENHDKIVSKTDYNKMLNDLKNYFNEMNISQNVFDIMMLTPPDKFEMYNYKNIEKIVPSIDPYFEEKTIYNESLWYKISTLEFRKLELISRTKCGYFSDYSDTSACYDSLIYNISYENSVRRRNIVENECKWSKILTSNEIEILKSIKPKERGNSIIFKKIIDCRYLVMTTK